MRAVDTNVLVRLLIGDDLGQTAAAEACVAQGVWASVLVIAETAWVLRTVYRRNSDDIADAVAMLLDTEPLAIQDRDVVEAALKLFRSRPSLGLSDCLMLELARKADHLPLVTFDRDLAKLDGTLRL